MHILATQNISKVINVYFIICNLIIQQHLQEYKIKYIKNKIIIHLVDKAPIIFLFKMSHDLLGWAGLRSQQQVKASTICPRQSWAGQRTEALSE